MPVTYKILGISAPANTNDTNDLYTVPASTQTIVSSIVVANTGTSDRTARIFIRSTSGTAAATSNAIIYDSLIPANSTVNFTLGITLGAGNIISIRTSNASSLTFSAFGSEIT